MLFEEAICQTENHTNIPKIRTIKKVNITLIADHSLLKNLYSKLKNLNIKDKTHFRNHISGKETML